MANPALNDSGANSHSQSDKQIVFDTFDPVTWGHWIKH